jgi:hypothetical protein
MPGAMDDRAATSSETGNSRASENWRQVFILRWPARSRVNTRAGSRIFVAFASLLILASACVLLSCQGITSKPPAAGKASSQLLYLIGDGTVSTYAVEAGTLTLTSLGQSVNLIPAGSLVQFVPGPNQFLYVLWNDGANQPYLSVYATDASGIPQITAVQTLDASSLSQFNIHRSGRFAYMMQISDSDAGYSSMVRLFHVDPESGKLREDPNSQGEYGPFNLCPALLYGFSADGGKLYLSRQESQKPFYEQRELDSQTGSLGPDVILYSPEDGWYASDTLVIGKQVMLDEHRATAAADYIDVLPLVPSPQHDLFSCTDSMLGACATAVNAQIDPSGSYVFLTDPATQRIHVARIALNAKRLEDTGSFIPMTAEIPGFAFSPDGTLVYAVLATDLSLHVYSFDTASGRVTGGGSSLPLASNIGFAPAAQR